MASRSPEHLAVTTPPNKAQAIVPRTGLWLRQVVARPWATDVGFFFLVVAVAALIRLPNLLEMPMFFDETWDTGRALAVSKGQLFPLTGGAKYFGPLFDYSAGLAIFVFGPNIYLPRMVALIFGSLAVGTTYILGRVAGGRTVGLVAAAFLATNPVHILLDSHVGVTTFMNTFFTSLALIAFYGFLQNNSGWLLVLTGLLSGLALQTHPVVVLILAAMVFRFLLPPSRIVAWLRSPWPYLALLAFAVGYGNMIWYNLQTGFGSIVGAQRAGTYEAASTVQSYFGHWATTLPQVVNLFSAVFRNWRSPLEPFTNPSPWVLIPWLLYSVLLGAALVYSARKGDPLPALTILTFLMVIPIFFKAFDFPWAGRYFTGLLPLIYVSVGGLLVAIWRRLGSVHWRLLLALLAAGLLVWPLYALSNYYTHLTTLKRDNSDLLTIAYYLRENRGPDTIIVLDDGLRVQRWTGGGNTFISLEYLLNFDQTPFRVLGGKDVTLGPILNLARGDRIVLVLAGETYDTLARRYSLAPEALPLRGLPSGYRLGVYSYVKSD